MRPWLRFGVIMMLIVLIASACTASVESTVRAPDHSSGDSAIDWDSCGAIQCGTLTVPLDHDDPDGDTIDLALTRVPATGDKIGSLFLNFGGPSGESGETMEFAGEFFGAIFGSNFDLVSWDPRGIGETERLQCEDFSDENFVVGLVRPEDGLDDELAATEASFERLAACASATGPIIDHLSTADVARDLDLLREAVGDDKLTYLGFSYGTMIGWVYATLFPNNVRAMVLDGAAPPAAFTVEGSVQQIEAFERIFDEYIAWCGDQSAICDASDEGLGERFDRLVDELDENPIDLAGDKTFAAHDLIDAVFDVLYQGPDEMGQPLDMWLTEVDAGDPTEFIDFVDFANDTLTPGAYKAVICADGYDIDTVEEEIDYITTVIDAAPRFGQVNFGSRCDLWPGEIKGLPELDTTGTPTLLVIGNTLDPATPYEAAIELDELLADSVLLTYEGAGHTIVGGNDCIDAFVLDYLVTLTPPPVGERCS